MDKDRFGYGTKQKPDLQGFLNSKEHKQWLNSPWDPEVDIHMLKAIFGAMSLHGGYGKNDTEKYLNDYVGMLEKASQKKGAPSPDKMHQALREMQYGRGV